MKSTFKKMLTAIVFLSLSVGVYGKGNVSSKIESRFGATDISLCGKIATEALYARSMKFLNKDIKNDAASLMKSTIDTKLQIGYAPEEKNPRIVGEVGARFKVTAGSSCSIVTDPQEITIAGADLTIPGSSPQNHLLWLRSANLKVALGESKKIDDRFVQFGLFPYSIGRGISLGDAYNAGGFFAFHSRFKVDQFAPGILLHTDFFTDSLELDGYFSILDNPNSSFSKNNQKIRENDLSQSLHGDVTQGSDRRKWVASGSLHWKPMREKDRTFDFNPYFVYHQAPDQAVEFAADADSTMWTCGLVMEYEYDRFSYGFETAINKGVSHIKPWDRNSITLASNPGESGAVTPRYTKIYTADTSVPANVIEANLAFASNDPASNNVTPVGNSARGFSHNSEKISAAPDLWNAPDRFRPEQNKYYSGWFFIADFAYECMKDQLTIAADAGYISGDLDRNEEVNNMTEEQRLNQKFAGFVPLQSFYSGKRVNHLVMLNEGVPRFAVEEPTRDLSELYTTTKVIGSAASTELTNLIYLGGSVEWKPQFAKEQGLAIKPTVIHYWMPTSPLLANGTTASSSLGTTISIEAQAQAWERLNFEGYFGVMLPGRQYEQFKGTAVKGGTLGNDIAFVVNVGVSYKF